MLGLAFVVRDVMMALTLAYNLLVGGMLIPLIGAIFWQRATSTGAIASMLTGSLSVLVLMYYHGIEANSPIYGGLLAGGAAFLIGSLLTRPGPLPQVQPE
jgi:SSS family solute:Na+ symporter